ncbi:filamentous hemagglutinin N-terminal domain-containing protein [Microcoleus sp. FACHB-SPT15]|uniref:two-partner secretion domain-containing protein n=1 Tax=Microcoleus sp. FACHB-SPT15 TaxID=2692830 RepID=UPI0017861634|nr:filamentous hemagglutinin N-terminal domain-containing protein [Microcoleus sp. FACHB-SPT15]MBD1806972.1 filamentous hemagglutinin N-terminal domain-containing protein [Microcoleus sp. FACHB-SPT15]
MKQFLSCVKVRGTGSISSGKTPERAIAKNLAQPTNYQAGIALGKCAVKLITLGISGTIPFGIALLHASTNTQAVAQITPDVTLGAEQSVVRPNVMIDDHYADKIEGGALRGSNLFHSFLEFNIGDGQRVYFANPSGIENILTRVSGSNASNILGTLGVTGSANLFLINPNGIIFGLNAQLDIAGSFLASTANSLVFEDGFAFSTANPDVPPLLTITAPIGLQYGSNQGGTISNSGKLSVGQNLTLAANNLNLQGELYAGRNLTLRALDTVKVRDNTTNPFIASSGRRLMIQGNREVNLMALNHPESGFFSGGDIVLRSANPIRGDAHYTSGSDFRIEKLDGSLGTLVSPFDPVIQASGDVSFSSYTGASLHVLAGSSVNIGSVTITGTEVTNYINQTVSLSDGTLLEVNGGARPTLDIRAGTTGFDSSLGLQGLPTPSNLSVLDAATSAEIAIDSITMSAADGLVLLTNQYNPNPALPDVTIQVGQINSSSSLGNGGDVVIDSRGGIVLSGNVNSQSTATASSGGAVTLIANDDITTTNIQSDSSFLDGGQISLTSRHGAIDTSAGSLTSLTDSPGRNGGQITLSANSDITTGNINSSGGKLGGGGDITLISNGRVSVAHSSIQSETFGFHKGGDIVITARSLSLFDNAFLSTNTHNAGDAGSVTITATDTVSFDGALSPKEFSGALSLVENGAEGNGGNLNITTGSLYVTNGAVLSASTRGEGDAGDVNINATDTVSFDGVGSNGLSSRATSRVNFGGQDNGDGGNLNITTGSLYVTNGAVLSASTFGYGDAGTVNITASDAIFIDGIGSHGFASAIASRVDENAQGNGGNLNITTGSLYITNAAQLSASTLGIGDAGNVNITATDMVYVDGISSNGFPTLIGSRVNDPGQGTGGNLNITTYNLSVTNGALVSVSSSNLAGQGSAGNLQITANSIFLDNQGKLSARTASGNGGNITLQIQDVLLLRNNSAISTNAGFDGTSGDGGNITINAGFIVAVPQENSDITANAYEGKGGKINITTQGIFGIDYREGLTSLSDITASSDFGLSGVVEISRPEVDPSQGLTSLPTDIIDTTGMIDYQCQVGRSSAGNKFTMTGRGGLPPNPNESLGEENWLEDLGSPMQVGEVGEAREIVSPVLGNASASSANQIVEAQGWMIDADGKVTLTVQVPAPTPVTPTSQQTWQVSASCQNIPNTANLTGTAH